MKHYIIANLADYRQYQGFLKDTHGLMLSGDRILFSVDAAHWHGVKNNFNYLPGVQISTDTQEHPHVEINGVMVPDPSWSAPENAEVKYAPAVPNPNPPQWTELPHILLGAPVGTAIASAVTEAVTAAVVAQGLAASTVAPVPATATTAQVALMLAAHHPLMHP